MIFSLLYIPVVVGVYLYFGIAWAGVTMASLAVLFSLTLLIQKKEKSSYVTPMIALILGLIATVSSDFLALKLYPLILSLIFLSYFVSAVRLKKYPLVVWVEKFKKRPLTLQEYEDVVVSHWFWIGVLGLNSVIHVLLVVNVGLQWWALYSFAGWYLLFGVAMVLQLGFAHRYDLRQWARNGWGYGLFGGVIVLGFIPAIVSFAFQRARKNPKSHVVFQSITAAMFRLFFRYAPNVCQVSVIKDDALSGDKHYIYAASHESWLDYPLMGAYITDLYHLTNKSNAFHWSIAGVAKLLGVVDGIGGNPLHHLLQKLRDNSNVLIFPEGSREIDGTLLPFKKGAFSLSLESGVPIVPVIIRGTRNLVAKGSMNWLNSAGVVITVKMLEPMYSLEGETVDRFKDRVWDVMRDRQNNHNG